MVLVSVGEHDSNYVVKSITDVAEVRQEHVDAGLVFFWKEHSAVDD